MRIHPFHLKLYHHHQNNLLLDAICLCDCSVFIIPPELGVVATSFRTDQSETHPSFNTITVMLISFGTSEDDFAAAAASFHRLLSSTVNALTHTHTHTHTRITACICQWLHYMSTERRERLGVCQHPTQVICDSFHTHARKHAHTRTHTHKHTRTNTRAQALTITRTQTCSNIHIDTHIATNRYKSLLSVRWRSC